MGYGDVEGLPKWFIEEEKQHCRASLPIKKELVERYKAKMKEINQRPTKKVAEARARKKRRVNSSFCFFSIFKLDHLFFVSSKELRKLEKVKKKAEPLLENADLDDKERNKQIKE